MRGGGRGAGSCYARSLSVGVDATGVLTPGAHLSPVSTLFEVRDSELSHVLLRPGFERGHAVGYHVFVASLLPILVVKPAYVETPSGD